MDNSSALEQLRDIHLPDPIGWWPPAIGWVLLGVFTLLVLLGLVGLLVRYVIHNRAKRQALRLLKTYQDAYLKQPNAPLTSSRISELLKRVALVYYPREKTASLSGEAWITFLNDTSKQLDFRSVSVLLIDCPYQPSSTHDLSPLFDLAQQWIKQRRGRCLK